MRVIGEYYVLSDDIWAAAGLEAADRMLLARVSVDARTSPTFW